MTCDIFNLKCIIVNELIGNSLLTVILGTIAFFIFASKIRFGFDTTIVLGFIYICLITLVVGGLIPFLVIMVMLLALYVGYYFNRVVGNR